MSHTQLLQSFTTSEMIKLAEFIDVCIRRDIDITSESSLKDLCTMLRNGIKNASQKPQKVTEDKLQQDAENVEPIRLRKEEMRHEYQVQIAIKKPGLYLVKGDGTNAIIVEAGDSEVMFNCSRLVCRIGDVPKVEPPCEYRQAETPRDMNCNVTVFGNMTYQGLLIGAVGTDFYVLSGGKVRAEHSTRVLVALFDDDPVTMPAQGLDA